MPLPYREDLLDEKPRHRRKGTTEAPKKSQYDLNYFDEDVSESVKEMSTRYHHPWPVTGYYQLLT